MILRNSAIGSHDNRSVLEGNFGELASKSNISWCASSVYIYIYIYILHGDRLRVVDFGDRILISQYVLFVLEGCPSMTAADPLSLG